MEIELLNGRGKITLLEKHDSSGRSADVWIGKEESGRELAVKIYRPTFEDGGLFNDSVDREALISCSDKRVVVSESRGIIPFSGERWSHFLTMQLIEGRRLDEHIKSGSLESGIRKHISKEIACALDSIHRCGYTHGDINPGNILFSEEDSSIHIVDLEFCLPLDFDHDEKKFNTLRGTPGYIAPEIHDHGIKASSPASDIWSLGCVIAEVLGGGRTDLDMDWKSQMKKHGMKSSILLDWVSGLGAEIDEFVRRCVIFDPRERIKLEELVALMESHDF